MVQLNLLPVLELFVGFAYNSASFVIDKRRLFFSLWTEYSIEEIRLKLIRGFVLQNIEYQCRRPSMVHIRYRNDF